MTREQVQQVADNNNLGPVRFETRIAQNTGNAIKVGFVHIDGNDELFVKRGSSSSDDEFYLCNQFRRMS